MQTKASILRTIKAQGYSVSSLLSVQADAKTTKGSKKGYLTGICYMMPTDPLCPVSELAGCREACLVSAGRAAFTPGIGRARAQRTKLFTEQKELFFQLLEVEIEALKRKAQRLDLVPAVRLNGTSDINYSVYKAYNGLNVFQRFSDIQFYDYTKSPSIVRSSSTISNWHITASYSGVNSKYADLITNAANKYKSNLAVVFNSKKLPLFYNGKPVINGDETDLRFLDKIGVIVGLSAKGKAKKDNSGFVIAVTN